MINGQNSNNDSFAIQKHELTFSVCRNEVIQGCKLSKIPKCPPPPRPGEFTLFTDEVFTGVVLNSTARQLVLVIFIYCLIMWLLGRCLTLSP